VEQRRAPKKYIPTKTVGTRIEKNKKAGVAFMSEESQKESQENKLEDVFSVSIKSRNAIDPYGIEALLIDYASKNTNIALEINHGPVNHQWGYGGTQKSSYRLIDDRKEILFEVFELNAWDTYSDDSEDHALPTTITVRAIPFKFDNLIQECSDLLKKYKI
jgi:hypothetical protein